MIMLGLIHWDETGTRVDGKTLRIHVASNRNYTYLDINKKRGQIGIDAENVLLCLQASLFMISGSLTRSIRM